jgi:glyoxylase-like metal-dependent hydrolase (beta-lactamase superfamily II)
MIVPVMSSGQECNCFIVAGKKCAIIDAGNPRLVLDKVRGLSIGIDYLLTTHYHHDHVSGLGFLRDALGGVVAVHEADASALEEGDTSQVLSYLFDQTCPRVSVDWRLKDGDVVDLGGLVLEVIHTPGHTAGCVCFYEPSSKSLFSGDTVFDGCVGRTDFAGGSDGELKESVEKLVKLYKERGVEAVYPGHGPIFSGKELEGIYRENFG